MKQIKDSRIEQCLNDMQKYEPWRNLLFGQSCMHLSNTNVPVSALAIHNGSEYIKASMKLYVLQDENHTDDDKEKRLKQIDEDVNHMEEVIIHDLEYRGMLMP